MIMMDEQVVTIGHDALYAPSSSSSSHTQHTHHDHTAVDEEDDDDDDQQHQDSTGSSTSSRGWASSLGDAVERAFWLCRRATQVWKNVSLLKHVLGASYPEARLLTFDDASSTTRGTEEREGEKDTLLAVITQKSLSWRRESEDYLVSWPVSIPSDVGEFVPTSATKDSSGLFIFVATTMGAVYAVKKGSRHIACVMESEKVPWNTTYYQDQPILVHAKPESASFTHDAIPAELRLTTLTASGRVWHHHVERKAPHDIKLRTYYVVSVGFTLVTAADLKWFRLNRSTGYILAIGGLTLDRAEHDASPICRVFWIPVGATVDSGDNEPTLLQEFNVSSISSSDSAEELEDEDPLDTLVENAKTSTASSLFRRKKTQNGYLFGLVRFFTRPHEFILLPTAGDGPRSPSLIRLQSEGTLMALTTTVGDFQLIDFNTLGSPLTVHGKFSKPISNPVFEWIDNMTGIVIGSGMGNITFRAQQRHVSCNMLSSGKDQMSGLDNESTTLSVAATRAAPTENLPLFRIHALQGGTQWQYLTTGLELQNSAIGITRPKLRIDRRIVSELSDPFKMGKVMPAYSKELSSFILRVGKTNARIWPTLTSMENPLASRHSSLIQVFWKLSSSGFLDVGPGSSMLCKHHLDAVIDSGTTLEKLSDTSFLSFCLSYLRYVREVYPWHGCALDVAAASSFTYCTDGIYNNSPRPALFSERDVGVLYRMRYYRMCKNVGVSPQSTSQHPASQSPSQSKRSEYPCSFFTDPLLLTETGNHLRIAEIPHGTMLSKLSQEDRCTAHTALGNTPKWFPVWLEDDDQKTPCAIAFYYASFLNEIDLLLESTVPEEARLLDSLVHTLKMVLEDKYLVFIDDFQATSDVVAKWYQDEVGISVSRGSDVPLFTSGGDAGSSLSLLPFRDLVFFKPDNVMHLFANKWTPSSVRKFIKRCLDAGNGAAAESALQTALGEQSTSKNRLQLLDELLNDNDLLSYNSSLWNNTRATHEVVRAILSVDELDKASFDEACRLTDSLKKLGSGEVLDILERAIALAETWEKVCKANQQNPRDDRREEFIMYDYGMPHFVLCVSTPIDALNHEIPKIDGTQSRGSSEVILQRLANISCLEEVSCARCPDVIASQMRELVSVGQCWKELCDGVREFVVDIMNSLMPTDEGEEENFVSRVQLWVAFSRFVMAAPTLPATALIGDICDMLLEYTSVDVLLEYCQELSSSGNSTKGNLLGSGVSQGVCCWLRRRSRQLPYIEKIESRTHLLYIGETLANIAVACRDIHGTQEENDSDSPAILQHLSSFSPICDFLSNALRHGVLRNTEEVASLLDNIIDSVQEGGGDSSAIVPMLLNVKWVEWEQLFNCMFPDSRWLWQRDELVESFRDYNEYRLITQQFKSLEGGTTPALYALLDDSEAQKRAPTWSSSSLGPLFNPLAIFSFQASSPTVSEDYSSHEEVLDNDSLLRCQCYRSLLESRGISNEDTDIAVPFYPGSQDLLTLVSSLDKGILYRFSRKSQILFVIEVGRQVVRFCHGSQTLVCLRALRQLLICLEEEIRVENVLVEKLTELLTVVISMSSEIDDLKTDVFCEVASLIGVSTGICPAQHLTVMDRLHDKLKQPLQSHDENSMVLPTDFASHPMLSHNLSHIIGQESFHARVSAQICASTRLNNSIRVLKQFDNEHENDSRRLEVVQRLATYDTDVAAGILTLSGETHRDSLLCSWLNELREKFQNDVIYEAKSPWQTGKQFELVKSQYAGSFNVWYYIAKQVWGREGNDSVLVNDHVANDKMISLAMESPTAASFYPEESFEIAEAIPLARILSIPVTTSSIRGNAEENETWQTLMRQVLSSCFSSESHQHTYVDWVSDVLFSGPSLVMRLYGILAFSSWAVQTNQFHQLLWKAHQAFHLEEEKVAGFCGVLVGTIASPSASEGSPQGTLDRIITDYYRKYPNLTAELIGKVWKLCDGRDYSKIQQMISLSEDISIDLPSLSLRSMRSLHLLRLSIGKMSLKEIVEKLSNFEVDTSVKEAVGLPILVWKNVPVGDVDSLLHTAYASGVRVLNRLARSKKGAVRLGLSVCEVLGATLSSILSLKAEEIGLDLQATELIECLPCSLLTKPTKLAFFEMLSLRSILDARNPDKYIQMQVEKTPLAKNSAFRLLAFVGVGSYSFWMKRFWELLDHETLLNGSSCVQEKPSWYEYIPITDEDQSRLKASGEVLHKCANVFITNEKSPVVMCSAIIEYKYVLLIAQNLQSRAQNSPALGGWSNCFCLATESEDDFHSCLKQSLGAILVYEALHGRIKTAIQEVNEALDEVSAEIRRLFQGAASKELIDIDEKIFRALFLSGISFFLKKALDAMSSKLLEVEAEQLVQKLSSLSDKQDYPLEDLLCPDIGSSFFVLIKCCEDHFVRQLAHANVRQADVTNERDRIIEAGDERTKNGLRYLVSEVTPDSETNSEKILMERLLPNTCRNMISSQCNTFKEATTQLIKSIWTTDCRDPQFRPQAEALLSLIWRQACRSFAEMDEADFCQFLSKDMILSLSRLSPEKVFPSLESLLLESRVKILASSPNLSVDDIELYVPPIEEPLKNNCYDALHAILSKENLENLSWLVNVCKGVPSLLLSSSEYERLMDLPKRSDRLALDRSQTFQEICAGGSIDALLSEIRMGKTPVSYLSTSTLLTLVSCWPVTKWMDSCVFSSVVNALRSLYFHGGEENRRLYLLALCFSELILSNRLEAALRLLTGVIGGSHSLPADCRQLHRFLVRSLRALKRDRNICELVCAAHRKLDKQMTERSSRCQETLMKFVGNAANTAESSIAEPHNAAAFSNDGGFASLQSWFSSM